MKIENHMLSINANGNTDIHDITIEIQNLIISSNISIGNTTIFTPSSTSAITTMEFESGCIQDFQDHFKAVANPNEFYKHNERWHDGNGHSHLCAALIGPSISVPVINKELHLGMWQQIVFVDFDNKPRQRKINVQIIGQ